MQFKPLVEEKRVCWHGPSSTKDVPLYTRTAAAILILLPPRNSADGRGARPACRPGQHNKQERVNGVIQPFAGSTGTIFKTAQTVTRSTLIVLQTVRMVKCEAQEAPLMNQPPAAQNSVSLSMNLHFRFPK